MSHPRCGTPGEGERACHPRGMFSATLQCSAIRVVACCALVRASGRVSLAVGEAVGGAAAWSVPFSTQHTRW